MNFEKMENENNNESSEKSFEEKINSLAMKARKIKDRNERRYFLEDLRDFENRYKKFSDSNRAERNLLEFESDLEELLQKNSSEDVGETPKESEGDYIDKENNIEERETLEKVSESFNNLVRTFLVRSQDGLNNLIDEDLLKVFYKTPITSDNFLDNIEKIQMLIENINNVDPGSRVSESLESLEDLGTNLNKFESDLINLGDNISSQEKSIGIKKILDRIDDKKKFLYKRYELVKDYLRGY